MTNPKTKPRTGAYLLKMVEEMSVPAPKVAHRVACTSEHLARVLYLHECLGGDMATFARVTGLHEDDISTIAKLARHPG